MLEVLGQSGATRLEVSENEAQRLKFWSGRKNAFPASGRISPDYMCMDSTIPRKRLADILIAIAEMEKTYALRCVNVFHAGDGNLHPLILFDANDPEQLHRAEAVRRRHPRDQRATRRHVTGEHGVGVEKLDSMCVQFTPEEREQMVALKRAFDPQRPAQPRQGDPDAAALRRGRQDARAQGRAAVCRHSAVLTEEPDVGRDRPRAAAADRARATRHAAPAPSSTSAAAAPRTSTARRRKASRST